jgi:non-ribosomal peptide synthetase component E (peptide arylation enzyme)
MLPAATTIFDLIAAQAVARGTEAAILSPERAPLTYSALRAALVRHGAALAAMGLGRRHRIAQSLPDGADIALASLVAMTWASALPLNAPHDDAECETLLRGLRADALIATIRAEVERYAPVRARREADAKRQGAAQ